MLLGGAEPMPLCLLEEEMLPTALAALDAAPLVPIEDNRIGAEWLHVLILLLRTGQLPASTLERLVLPWALCRGEVRFSSIRAGLREPCPDAAMTVLQVSAPVCHRLLCTHVLGALADAHPNPAWIDAHFLGQALTMCQDTELAVRSSMCDQLHRLASALGPTLAGGRPLTAALARQDCGVRRRAGRAALCRSLCCLR